MSGQDQVENFMLEKSKRSDVIQARPGLGLGYSNSGLFNPGLE